MWIWAIGEDGFIGHYLGWVLSRDPQVGLGKWFSGGFIGGLVLGGEISKSLGLLERFILSLPFHSPLFLQSLSLVHGLSFCGGLRSSYSLGSFLVAHHLWGCLLFYSLARRICVGSQYRYPSSFLSFLSTPYCGMRLNFLLWSCIWIILYCATPFFSGDKWFLSSFWSPISCVKGLLMCYPYPFLSILIIILAVNLKLVPCAIVCCASKGCWGRI